MPAVDTQVDPIIVKGRENILEVRPLVLSASKQQSLADFANILLGNFSLSGQTQFGRKTSQEPA